jgi:hypothetical protein
MNANELAEIQAFKTEELTMWERNHTAAMLRQQADRIKELEQAIKDADEWLESGEGVSLCYYSFSDSNPKSIKIIKEITG